MLSIMGALGIGYLLSLLGLDELFDYLLGFTSEQYYLVWFGIGCVMFVSNVVERTKVKHTGRREYDGKL